MNKKELTGAVTRLLQEPLEQNGFVLWDIDYIKNREGAQLVIRPSPLHFQQERRSRVAFQPDGLSGL